MVLRQHSFLRKKDEVVSIVYTIHQDKLQISRD